MNASELTPLVRSRRRLAFVIALGLVAALLVPLAPWTHASPTQAAEAQQTVVLPVAAASWTTSREPGRTHGQLPYISATKFQDRSYLKFDGSKLKGKRVVSAKLVLRVTSSTVTKPGVLVYPSSSSWNASTITHNNRPTDLSTQLNSVTPLAAAGQSISIPLKNLTSISTSGAFSFRVQYAQQAIRSQYARTGPSAPTLVLVVASAATTPTAKPTATPTPEPTATSAPRPSPAPTTPAADSKKKVFAIYFPPFPTSLDNKDSSVDYYARNYLTVDGEGGIHASYGGLLRDRPLPVKPSSSSSWKVDNLRTEIRQAKAAGIDGFFVNIMSASGINWDITVDLFAAARLEGGFPIIPMVDGTTSISRLTPAAVASSLATLYRQGPVYKEGAQNLLSSFKAEGPGASWWAEIIRLLESQYGIPITFQAVFLSTSDANLKAFSGIADSYGNWGARYAPSIDKLPDFAATAAKLGKTWMEPVAPQDMRPRLGVYAEAGNTEALRAGWAKAIRDDVDYVQMVTWNDYSESTQFAPSVAHGNVYVDINKYYSQWYHTGQRPTIATDALYLTHRIQFADATAKIAHKPITATLSGSVGAVRDTVEALVFLTKPATVEITVGGVKSTFQASAGVTAFTAPLRLGAVQARIVRDGTAVRSAVSPFTVVKNPAVQDLQYYGVVGK